jgi:hypothetical protein
MSSRLGEETIIFEKNAAHDLEEFVKTVAELDRIGVHVPEGITIQDLRSYILAKNETEWMADRLYTLGLSLGRISTTTTRVMVG